MSVRQTVLRGLALNRTPGYHFTGHFLSVSHDHVSIETARTSMKVGPHCAEANGSIDYGALSVFADLSMAANVLDPPKGQTLRARQLRREQDADVAPLEEGELEGDEREILQRADEALAAQDGGAFVVRTAIVGGNGRRAMEMITTHAHKA